jgi:hypothetical protein
MKEDYTRVVAETLCAYQSAVIELRARAEDLLAQIRERAAAVQALYLMYGYCWRSHVRDGQYTDTLGFSTVHQT